MGESSPNAFESHMTGCRSILLFGGMPLGMDASSVKCRSCGLKYFVDQSATCPRCNRGQAASTGPSSAASASGAIDSKLLDAAKERLLVWNDAPAVVEQMLIAQGVAPEEARTAVATLVRSINASRAAHARSTAIVHLIVAVPVFLAGAGVLYGYFRARQDLEWRPNFFTGSLLLVGIVLSLAGAGTTLRAVVRILTGRSEPGD